MAGYREARTPTSGSKQLDHLVVKNADKGGHVVEHHYRENGMAHFRPKEYNFGADEGADLLAHVAKHGKVSMAEGGSGEETE